ncbi:MAG: hypothetical protein A2X61_12040 [Ignavibacteria bacterium GWB2_35_12]|nr:MAG: hypothetical protein A2X63_00970 [Ignavibacteria bacterium GWA2_35_8]OGU41989.1 MAG: hypothetical protein A2X61_12040 [Ignavibacteria bacterium GWB2_35_12]OGU87272.1 MAG: hypothetical protein A2220_01200 [Ignavibacteria bacterium RIFOXYA2_FULL_35_10]OGV24417.1 MAG: hypothetical protein A2475_12560 [Ignavibacteria bacterium RIFOXYC2_FULL_35_21]
MKLNLKIFIIVVLCIVLNITNANAQGRPNPPTFRNIALEGTGSYTRFKLDWSMLSMDTSQITKFKIYKAGFFTNNPNLLSYFATVLRYGTDTTWTTNVNPIYIGDYSFYITSIRTISSVDYESFPSNILQARFKQGHVDVNFTTIPPTIGSVGTLYQYDADASSTDPAPVNYVLTSGPQAMSVDLMSGLVQWTPSVTGRYNIILNAFLNFNPIGLADKGKSDGALSDEILIDTSDCDADQSWLLLIKSCNNPTYFSGNVVDENGDTIREGLITAYSVNSLDIDSIYYGTIGSDGRYQVEVLEGAYKLSAEGETFFTEWYNDKPDMNQADSAIAPCGRSTTVNWVVTKKEIPPDTVLFAYEPVTVDLLGNQYIYNGFAMATSGREVRYHLDEAPQGMEVDLITGIVIWTPSQIGRYYVSLKAYVYVDSAKSYAYKNFYIQIRSCSQDSYVKGTVKDNADNAIKQGNVTIHSDGGIDSTGIYYGTINQDGAFLVKIDEGNCKTYVDGEGFISQWYDNEPSKDSATAVPCPCGDTTEINLSVTRTAPLNLSIISSPSNSTLVGSLYSYNPIVTGNAEREVRYMFIDKPQGMTINNLTGAVQWSPSNIGGYRIILKAYLYTDSANSFALQEWWLKVRSCTDDTYMSGTVRDENNNPIPTGSVRIVTESGIDSLGYYIGTIENGNYRVLVDEGRCKVYAEGPTFRGEWYEDKTSEQTATAIDVPCGSTSTANFTVHIFTNYTVSGRVIDEMTGNPIENASVYFQGSDFMDSINTNQTGDYSISLYEKNSYIAWANVPQNPMNITQYYSLTGNITEATPVEFSNDINNINFALKIAPPTDNRMYGIVESEDGEPIKSIVLNLTVFPADTSIASMFDARTYLTGNNGTYEFLNLAEGDYLLLAIPYSDKAVPGYFKQDSTAVPSWLDATIIKIVSGELSGPHIISLPFTLPTTGNGRISGIITGDMLPAFLKPDDSPLAKEAVSGAVVICVDEGKNERKYNLSNSKGVYKLDSLEAGDYQVNVDKFGYGQYTFDVTIDNDNQSHNVDAELSLQIPVGIFDDKEYYYNIIRIYPNPSEGQFIIQSDIDMNSKDISLTNLYGQPIILEYYGMVNNTNSIIIKAENVSQGLYFLKIEKKGNSYIQPVVIVK